MTNDKPHTFEEMKSFYYTIYFPKLKYEKPKQFESPYEAEKYVYFLLRLAKRQAEKLEDNRDIPSKDLIIYHLSLEGFIAFNHKEFISELSIDRWIGEFKINNIFEIRAYKK